MKFEEFHELVVIWWSLVQILDRKEPSVLNLKCPYK